MKIRIILATAAVAITGVLGVASADASGLTPTKVTIEGNQGDYFGYVHSSDQANCELNRTVKVYKMVGTTPNHHVDQKIGSDLAQPNGPDSMWSIGNSGFKHGKFYARTAKTSLCKAGQSPVIKR